MFSARKNSLKTRVSKRKRKRKKEGFCHVSPLAGALTFPRGDTATARSQDHGSPLPPPRKGGFMSLARPVSTLYGVRKYELLTACARLYTG